MNIQLSLQVRTRSKVQDYRFIGQQPDDRWWENSYGRWTDFARPTLIVEPGRFFIAGISSKRSDSKGARIHYALLGEISTDEAATAAERLIAWICHEQLATDGRIVALGELLDELSEDVWSAAVGGESAAEELVASKLMSMMIDLPTSHAAGEVTGKWTAGPGAEGFRKLANTAAQVMTDKAGLAAFLNLAAIEEIALHHYGTAVVGIVLRDGSKHPKPCALGLGGR